MTVILSDIRALNYCNKGVRFFCKKHGIDYTQFIKHGIDADILLKTNDAMALGAIEQAKKREAEIE